MYLSIINNSFQSIFIRMIYCKKYILAGMSVGSKTNVGMSAINGSENLVKIFLCFINIKN